MRHTYARIQKILARGGPTLTSFFLYFYFIILMRGKRIQIALNAGHHLPASETPFKWLSAGGPMIAQHIMLTW